MTKQEFIDKLRAALSGLPQKDIEERLGFYSEMIDDRIEEGISEEDAVFAIGSYDEIASQIKAEAGLQANAEQRIRLKPWVIVLLVLGAPIWLSLAISAVAVIFSLCFVSLWSLVISPWAAFGLLVTCALYGMVSGIGIAIGVGVLPGLALIGAGLICAGLSIFLFFGCNIVTKGTFKLTKNIFIYIKKVLAKRRQQNEQGI